MKVLILVSCFHLFLLSSCQTNNSVNDVEEEIVFHHNEKTPKFKGGLDSLNSWLKRELVYPNSIVGDTNKREVLVRFFVDSTGRITDAFIEKSSDNRECDNEALRTVKSMPKWEEGTLGSYFNLPIIFQGN